MHEYLDIAPLVRRATVEAFGTPEQRAQQANLSQQRRA